MCMWQLPAQPLIFCRHQEARRYLRWSSSTRAKLRKKRFNPEPVNEDLAKYKSHESIESTEQRKNKPFALLGMVSLM